MPYEKEMRTLSSGSSGISLSPKGFQESLVDDITLPKTETIRLRKKHYGSPCALHFREDPLKIVRGEGQYLYDDEGHQYLDCVNNVAHVGHCHPHVTEVACQQIAQLYTNNRYLHDHLSSYVYRLAQLFPDPLEICFLCNSGSEANDLALQLAKTYTGGSEVITLAGGYHGHLQACLDVSPYKYKKGGKSKPDYVHVAPSPDVYRGFASQSSQPGHDYALKIKEIIDDVQSNGKQLSSFIMESLQSCGGQVIPPPGYMREAFSFVREAGGVCIADEVQVGFGRVGTHYWAFEEQGVIPDIVTIGKPMGNGHPVAGVVTTRAIADSLRKSISSHFNTFGGNPVSCAIANAVLDVIEDENLLNNARVVGQYALDKLQILEKKYQFIGDIRGRGLFFGVELVKNRKTKEPATALAVEILHRMRERFVLVSIDGPHNNVIKCKPPMCFTKNNVDHLVQTLDEVMSTLPDISLLSQKNDLSNNVPEKALSQQKNFLIKAN